VPLRGELSRHLLARITRAVEHDFRAVAARGLEFHPRRVFGHDDHRLDAEQPAGERYRLGVVAGREGDHAALLAIVAEL
jgi:hypothetical protein